MTLNTAMIVGGTVICAVGYRVFRRKLPQQTERHIPEEQPVKREDVIALLAAITGIAAMLVVAAIAVRHGMNMGMSAGAYVSERSEIVIRSLLYLPDVLGGIAWARAQTKWTVLLAAPCFLVYFVPALARNLGL